MIRYVDSSEVCLSVRSLGLQNYAGGDEDEVPLSLVAFTYLLLSSRPLRPFFFSTYGLVFQST